MNPAIAGEPLAPRRLATRLSFFAAGFAMACWAPLVPLATGRPGRGRRATDGNGGKQETMTSQAVADFTRVHA